MGRLALPLIEARLGQQAILERIPHQQLAVKGEVVKLRKATCAGRDTVHQTGAVQFPGQALQLVHARVVSETAQQAIGGDAWNRDEASVGGQTLDQRNAIEVLPVPDIQIVQTTVFGVQYRGPTAVERAHRDPLARRRCGREIAQRLAAGQQALDPFSRRLVAFLRAVIGIPGGIELQEAIDLSLQQLPIDGVAVTHPVQGTIALAAQIARRGLPGMLDQGGGVGTVRRHRDDVIGHGRLAVSLAPVQARRGGEDELRPGLAESQCHTARCLAKQVGAVPQVTGLARRGDEALYRADGKCEQRAHQSVISPKKAPVPAAKRMKPSRAPAALRPCSRSGSTSALFPDPRRCASLSSKYGRLPYLSSTSGTPLSHMWRALRQSTSGTACRSERGRALRMMGEAMRVACSPRAWSVASEGSPPR